MAVLRMVDFRIVKRIWQTNKIDLVPLFATFFTCFYELDIGILCGVLIAIVVFLYRRLVPEIEILGEINGRYHFKLHGGLTYIGVEYLTSKVREKTLVNNKTIVIILECSTMFECDFTVTEGLVQLYNECTDRDVKLIFCDVRKDVRKMLQNADLPTELFKSDLPEDLGRVLNTP